MVISPIIQWQHEKKTIKDRAKNKRSRDGASIGELDRLGHAGLDMVRWGAQRVG